MNRLERAAEHLEARKAAAFGVRDIDELDGPQFAGNDAIALVLSGEDVNVLELQDLGRVGVMNLWNAAQPQDLEQVARVLQSAWIEGVLFGLSLSKVPHE